MDVWAWISDLPNSTQWSESDPSEQVFELATQSDSSSSTRSIRLRAERTISEAEVCVTFTINLHGFGHVDEEEILWVSDTCSLSSDKPFLPLVLQLLQETIARSPTAHDSTSPRCPRSQLQKLKGEVVSWIMDSHSPESFSAFFALALLSRLFWVCALDAPAEAGSLFFKRSLAPAIKDGLLSAPSLALRTFFSTAGADAELCFTRSVAYMLAKWCLIRDHSDDNHGRSLISDSATAPLQHTLGFSHATEAHGYWTLKGYAPVPGMNLTRNSKSNSNSNSNSSSGDLVLKYVLAHQQLEAVVQLEYSVRFYEGYIQVNARVDNLRLHVARLGYGGKVVVAGDDKGTEFGEESHFPSRVRVWVGPEVGANYVSGLSLGRSTQNTETEIERKISTTAKKGGGSGRVKSRTKSKSWRWDQDAEGNAAVFEAVLIDRSTGRDVAISGGEGGDGLRGRYCGAERAFTKSGGVVLAGDEYGEGVGWRVSKEMEGSVLKWRIGGRVWVSYCPNVVANASLFETRCVEWCDEVDLPLIPAKILTF